MIFGKRKLDHIVYVVKDLAEACDHFEALLGVRPVFGGYHPSQGTKNALISLGNDQYLELIAIDYDNKKIAAPRWMGIDLIQKAQVTRWAIKSDNLVADAAILQKANPQLGQIKEGKRQTSNGDLLEWKLLLPLAHPEVELLPFSIDWGQNNTHPTNSMDDNCELVELFGYHPKPESITPTLIEMGIDLKIFKAETIKLKAKINCPNGIVEI
ncbi:VOC family protein [Roseivirga sp.]|uniref:VOC family protein n=1 Tax=Roseivirga sp. TaxID=1964215 RepID=UPI003B8B387F